MSKQRNRQQGRANRREAVHRETTNGRVLDRVGLSDGFDSELDEMLAGLAEIVVERSCEPETALEAEHWTSSLLGALNVGRMVDAEIRRCFRGRLVAAVEKLGTAEALASLRALSAVGVNAERARAQAAAGRLAATGV
jgi:hypothetical protein